MRSGEATSSRLACSTGNDPFGDIFVTFLELFTEPETELVLMEL